MKTEALRSAMEIRIFQLSVTRFMDDEKPKMSNLHHVATLGIPDGVFRMGDLERAFELTNSIDLPWPHNRLTTPHFVAQLSTPLNPFHDRVDADTPYPYRSTSTGDVMQVVSIDGKNKWYVVAMIGFKEIEEPR